KELKYRGLLGDTLIGWGSEFGRTPLGENRKGREANTGRDHHPYSFTLFMAGGGTKGGLTYGATDEIGWNITENPVHINDFHATILHLFGLDHLRLTHRFQGRDYRLTDVAGDVVAALVGLALQSRMTITAPPIHKLPPPFLSAHPPPHPYSHFARCVSLQL